MPLNELVQRCPAGQHVNTLLRTCLPALVAVAQVSQGAISQGVKLLDACCFDGKLLVSPHKVILAQPTNK